MTTWTLRDPDLVAERKLGAGGCGVTFLATRQSSQQTLAVKILHPELSADEGRRDAFINISRQAQAIGHTQIAGVEAFHSDAGQIYLTRRFVRGVNLAQLIERVRSIGALSPPAALAIIRQLCDVLESCLPLPHGALWPENIVFDWAGVPHLVDFGAWLMPIDHVAAAEVDQIHRYAHCTPEHMRAQPITSATDVFSLGVLLFELLTGRALFSATDANELIEAVGNAEVGAIRGIAAPEQGLLSHCLQRAAKTRFEDTGMLGREIDRLIDSSSQTNELHALLGGFAPTLAHNVDGLDQFPETTGVETDSLGEVLYAQETTSEDLTDPRGTPFAAEPTVVGEPEKPAQWPRQTQRPSRTEGGLRSTRAEGPNVTRVPLPQTGEFAIASMAISIEELSSEIHSSEVLRPIDSDSDDPWAALDTDAGAPARGSTPPAQVPSPSQPQAVPQGQALPPKESQPTALELALQEKVGGFSRFQKRFGWTYLLLGFTVVVCLGALGLLVGRLSSPSQTIIRNDAAVVVSGVDAAPLAAVSAASKDLGSASAPDLTATTAQDSAPAKPTADSGPVIDAVAKQTEVAPTPRAGRLHIETNPAATIYVDGKKRGKSPLKLRLRAGRKYTVVAAAEKRELWIKTLRLPKKTGVSLRLELKEAAYPEYDSKRRRGVLAVRCKRTDRRRIFIDRKDSGRSCPKATFLLKPKRYRISFVDSAKGKATETFKRALVKRRKTIVLRPRKRR